MQTLSLVVAAASGSVIGYATANYLAAGARNALRAKLKDETNALIEAEGKLKALKSGDGKKSGSKNKSKNKKSDKDAKKLEKQIADANRELERLKDAQMAADKAHADALSKVESKLEDAKSEAAEATHRAESGDVSEELTKAIAAAGASMDGILGALVEHAGQAGALLGDSNGIVVAQAGDTETVENTAAATNTIVSLPQKLDGMLPLNKHFGFQLQDGENSISGHSFESEGELLALTTVGRTPLNAATIEAVVKSLTAALS